MSSQVQNSGINSIGAVDAWMKIISANVTGSAVTGYKGQNVEFSQVLSSMTSGPIEPTDGYGSVDPVQNPDSGIKIASTDTDFSQGTVQATNQASNLAINGDGFFMVSKTPVAQSMDDITFTRNGDFHWEELPGTVKDANGNLVKGVGTFRLVNSDGQFVQGWQSPVVDQVRPFDTAPAENQGTTLGDLSTTTTPSTPGGPPVQVPLQGIQLDLARNPDAANNITFDSKGLVRVDGNAPIDLQNNQTSIYVTVVKFANQAGLERSGGADFKYDPAVGQMFSGVAGVGNQPPGKVVGSANTITPSALENANTSINVTIPEITLAQKTFTASTKIVFVANAMIDDANGLVH